MKKAIRFALLALALGLSTVAMAAKVNINTADARTLAEAIRGVGPAKAQAIVEYREAHGPFGSVEELEKVPGIGPATLRRNTGVLTVGGEG
jgi:competence protein ComEA